MHLITTLKKAELLKEFTAEVALNDSMTINRWHGIGHKKMSINGQDIDRLNQNKGQGGEYLPHDTEGLAA